MGLALQWKYFSEWQGVCTKVDLEVSWDESGHLEESWRHFFIVRFN
jgi:hypothetical protein